MSAARRRARRSLEVVASLLVLGLALLAAPGLDAARADAAQVTVVSPGGAQQTLALSALAGSEDVIGREYTLRTGSGETRQTLTGFSLARILDAAGADPYSFRYLEVQRPGGGAVRLSRDQALDEGAFADGPPVIHATATGTGFLRPSAGPDDANATDSFEAPQGITINLRKDVGLEVRAKATPRKTMPGKQVSFEAIVDGLGAGEEATIFWSFDDGTRASGPEVRHAFAKPGSYDVVVGVTTATDSTGASDVVTVRVGKPAEGPDRKGGGNNEDATAPDHGAATGIGGGGGEGGGSLPPAATPAPTAPSPAPERRQRPKPPPVPQPSGELVTGEVLETLPEATPEAATVTPAARTGDPDGGDGGGGGIPDEAIGLLITGGLLGLGALVEARGLAHLLPRRL